MPRWSSTPTTEARRGPPGAPVRITIRSPVAVSYIAQAPGSLGLARAYVAGHLDVDGDMYTALARMAQAQRVDLSLSERLPLLERPGRAEAALPAGAAAAAGGAGAPPLAGRAAALQGP